MTGRESHFEHWSDGPDPHRERRRQLMTRYPELKRLFGFSYLTSAIMIAVVAAQLGLAAWVQRSGEAGHWAGSAWFTVILAWTLGGTLNHWLSMGVHEATHNLVARTELGNRLMSLVANIPVILPGAMSFRRYHMRHHSHLGIYPDDNDLAMPFEAKWVGRSPWRKLVWLFFYLFFAAGARGFLKRLSGWEIANIAFMAVVCPLIVWGLGWHALGYLALSTFLGHGLHPASAHFIHEHYVWNDQASREAGRDSSDGSGAHGYAVTGVPQETYSYYGPLNWVTFNVGYHNEHHDLMWIPGWKLPLVKRIAPELYDGLASHRSWTWLLWHFITNRGVGHDSRIARGRETLKIRRLFSGTDGLRRERLTSEEERIERVLPA